MTAYHSHAYTTARPLNYAALAFEDLLQARAIEERRRLVARIQEVGREICEHLSYEDYCLWVDSITGDVDDDRATLEAHEAKLASLRAEAEETIAEGCPTAHAHARPCFDYGQAEDCPDCGKIL